MNNRQLTIFLLISILLIGVGGCKVTKNFTENESLLIKNKITLITPKKFEDKQLLKENLAQLPIQKPNKKVFYVFPIRLWLFTAANKGKENKFKWWMKNNVGEEPVMFKKELADKSTIAIIYYLQNYGFLYAKVSQEYITKKKKTTVKYTVEPGEYWKIGKVVLPNAPFATDTIVANNSKNSFIKAGEKFEVVALKNERERVESLLRDNGYFTFSKDYINFDLDTSNHPKIVDVYYKISQVNDSTQHEVYVINDINVTTDFNVDYLQKNIPADTIYSKKFNTIYRKKKFSPIVIDDGLFLMKNNKFSETDQNKTIKRFVDYGAFKFVAIDYERAADSLNKKRINANVHLTPSKRQSIGADAQANINFEGFFGFSGTLSYKNKNLVKHADLLAIDLSTGVQFQYANKQPVRIVTTDFTANAAYYWNRLLIPFVKKERFKNLFPKTKFNLRYYFQKRYNFDSQGNYEFFYDMHNYSTSMTYEWSKGTRIKHYLSPITFSMFLLPKKGDAFIQQLDASPSLRLAYEEQILFGSSYSIIFSNQKDKKDNNFFYVRGSFESIGNLLMAGFSLANIGKNKPLPYTIAQKPFSEFIKAEIDFRIFRRVSLHSSFASRVFVGLAYAYGNTQTIPFIKQFYTGGPNSMRGFSIREIGPGSYRDPNATGSSFGLLTQTGDMKIELNAEYRFDMYKWLKGAFFLDVGNVWLMHKTADRPNGDFQFNRFWNEFAINTGAGVRLDFNYFVIRLDYGIPLRNPSLAETNKWKVTKGNFQLGVGYPF